MLFLQIQLSDYQSAIYWNGAIFLAIVLSFMVQWSEIKRLKLHPLSSFVIVAAVYSTLLIGSRLGAISWQQWLEILQFGYVPSNQGKTIIGGVFLALPIYLILQRRWKLEGAHADALFIALPLVAAVARLGCIAGGCCFGVCTNSPFAWTYAPDMPAYNWQLSQHLITTGASHSLPVYPVQVLFSVVNLLLFWVLWKARRSFKKAGTLALLTLGSILLLRFGIEFIREAVTNRGVLGILFLGLKIVQWFCLVTGITLVYFGWRNEQKEPTPTTTVRIYIPPLEMAIVLLLIFSSGLFAKSLLSLNERAILILASTPAISLAIAELWRNWQMVKNRSVALSLYSLVSILMLYTAADTIPQFTPKTHWLNVSVRGSAGNYQTIARNCDGDVVNRELTNLSNAGIDVNYQYFFGENTSFGAGFYGSSGLTSLNNIDSRFKVLSPYLQINAKHVGLGAGLLWDLSKNSSSLDIPNNISRQYLFLRLGSVKAYHFTVGLNEMSEIPAYPQPYFNWGIFNWGFKDPSGLTNLRVGLTLIDLEAGFFMSGRAPFKNSPFSIDGGLYIQGGLYGNIGLKYRWKL